MDCRVTPHSHLMLSLFCFHQHPTLTPPSLSHCSCGVLFSPLLYRFLSSTTSKSVSLFLWCLVFTIAPSFLVQHHLQVCLIVFVVSCFYHCTILSCPAPPPSLSHCFCGVLFSPLRHLFLSSTTSKSVSLFFWCPVFTFAPSCLVLSSLCIH